MPGQDPRKFRKEGRRTGPTTFFVGKDGKRKDIKSMTREERKEFLKERMESPRPQPEDTPMMARGGRAGLKGGGICKKGMNRQAVGKNS